jgi:hypothetical protein
MIRVRHRVGSASDMGRNVNFGPSADHKRNFTPKRCCRIWNLHGSYQHGGLISPAHEKLNSSISLSGSARAIGGALQGRPRQSRIFRIASRGMPSPASRTQARRDAGPPDGFSPPTLESCWKRWWPVILSGVPGIVIDTSLVDRESV